MTKGQISRTERSYTFGEVFELTQMEIFYHSGNNLASIHQFWGYSEIYVK